MGNKQIAEGKSWDCLGYATLAIDVWFPDGGFEGGKKLEMA
jgi:hypothetical protein